MTGEAPRLIVRIPTYLVPRGRKPDDVKAEILERLRMCAACDGFALDIEIGGYVPQIATGRMYAGTFDAIAGAGACVSAALVVFDF